ncbi:uncharacterized protein LOC106670755 [Cimex lectularius]|uniref:Regulatory protein zeste n=1 Tax=Cimex lectularius TaxID=79782 RepID=A0A8I6S633_CIMLE|nr:uncharacterized protein LOC106670755 [Cimex lectularius]XP_024082487.1 uncharacterized protein LOC106670755 [Cimex lectularius]
MECVPDLAFLQMAAASNSDMFNKMLWHPTATSGGSPSPSGGGTMKQRKTNFTSREVEALLGAVADRKDTVLFGVAGGIGWARAWHEVAQHVSAVEGIHRSESDVRKKWTYLKWEAKNTSKPGRDPTSRAVLDILTSRDRDQPNSLLEQLLVPQGSPSSPGQTQNTVSPVPIAPKKHSVSSGQTPTQPGSNGGNVAQQETIRQNVQQSSIQMQQTAQLPQPPEVCLKWNSYHSNMRATFPNLLNNEQFVDVTLACEGRSIKCHKVMLSACSSYFEELLSQNPCQHPIVFMRDLKFWEVQALVEFMYSGEVNVTQDRLPSLLAAADALQIKGLAGPSTGASSAQEDDRLSAGDTDDTATIQHIHHQPLLQKRVRKRKSTNPTAYPVRSQCIAQALSSTINKAQAHSNQTHQPNSSLQHQLKHKSMHSAGNAKPSAGVLTSSGYSPPAKSKREDDSSPNSPLALIKDEPLDLGIDSKETLTNYRQRCGTSILPNDRDTGHISRREDLKDENGVSDEDMEEQHEDDEFDGGGYDSKQENRDCKRFSNGDDEDSVRGSRESTPKKDKL